MAALAHPLSPAIAWRSISTLSNIRGVLSAVLLLAFASAILAIRFYTYDEPLERDITTYAVVGHELLAGSRLYTDTWDHKPPAIYWTFAIAELALGYGQGQVFALGLIAALGTLFAIRRAATNLSGSQGVGLLAAAFWAVISGDMLLEANQPNSEAFINLCLAWSFALFVGLGADRLRGGTAVGIGLLLGLAVLYKPVVLPAAFLFGLAQMFTSSREERRHAILQVSIVGAALIAVDGIVMLSVLATSGIESTVAALVTFNSAYSGNVLQNELAALSRLGAVESHLRFLLPLAAFTGIALVADCLRKRFRPAVFLLAYVLGTYLAVNALPQTYRHYEQLWLPVLAIGGACGLFAAARIPVPHARLVSAFLAAAVLVVVIRHEALNLRLTPDQWSERKFGPMFTSTRVVATEITSILEPGERFWEWGSETGLYFYTKQRPITAVFSNFPLLVGPLFVELRQRVTEDLSYARPELLIERDRAYGYERSAEYIGRHLVMAPVWDDYTLIREVSFRPGHPVYRLYALRGSALQQRTAGEAVE